MKHVKDPNRGPGLWGNSETLPQNFENPFFCQIDVSSIAIFGHSMGAMTSAIASTEEGQKRIHRSYEARGRSHPLLNFSCGFGLDVWFDPFPEEKIGDFVPNIPFMGILSEHWAGPSAFKFKRFGENTTSEFFEVWFRNAFHQNGNDFCHVLNPTFWSRTWIPGLKMAVRNNTAWPTTDLSVKGIAHNKLAVSLLLRFLEAQFSGEEKEKSEFLDFFTDTCSDMNNFYGSYVWREGRLLRQGGDRPEKQKFF
jgi:hypothetical protein